MTAGRRPGSLRSIAIVLAALAAAAAAGSNACVFDTRTTLCEQSGLRCKEGQQCAVHQAVCIDIGGCGDGVINGNEACDDGNIVSGDGCRADCMSNETCGNGITDVGEECDGQANCGSDCRTHACGNGRLDPGEVCDDGNANPDDGCSADCRSNEACGNGIIDDDRAAGGKLHEECEFSDAPFPGPVMDTAVCNSDCTIPKCGDGHTNLLSLVPADGRDPEHLEQCDSGVMGVRMNSSICNSDCTIPSCGDGFINPMFKPPGATTGEQCDDGVANSDTTADACRKNCQPASCGDGVHDAHEQCDDGNDLAHDLDHDGKINSDTLPDACRTDCRTAFCGDGVIDLHHDHSLPAEECDDGDAQHGGGNRDAPNACRTSCKLPTCGDGIIDSGNGEHCERDSELENHGCPVGEQCDFGSCQCATH